MAETHAIRVIAISKSYCRNGKTTEVFRDFGFTAGTGEVTALMGRNGSGKTTLLNLIVGNIQPDNGCVEVLGEKPGDRPVGFVVQDYRATLLPWYTVQENIELPLRLRQADQAKSGESIRRLLTDLQLETLPVERFPYELSGGQQQLVCILRAFAYSSKLLMLDEPTSALDASKQREVWNVLSALHEYSRPTTVLVTHDVDEALILGDRIVFLDGAPANVRIDVRNPVPSPRSISDLATPPMVELRRDIRQMW